MIDARKENLTSAAICLILCLMATSGSGCGIGQALLAGLMGYSLVDGAGDGSSRAIKSPKVQVVQSEHNWAQELQNGCAAYRAFQYPACIQSMNAVFGDATATLAARIHAHMYRGVAAYLSGHVDAAMADFAAVERLGGTLDTYLIRPDVLQHYRLMATRCAAPAH